MRERTRKNERRRERERYLFEGKDIYLKDVLTMAANSGISLSYSNLRRGDSEGD